MDLLTACENQLGWVPASPVWKSRAAMHHRLKTAMTREGRTEDDLALALAWCIRRKQAIRSPLDLIALVQPAREIARITVSLKDLDQQVIRARGWETTHTDEHTDYWVGRLVRASGPARADLLAEWLLAGRGTY